MIRDLTFESEQEPVYSPGTETNKPLGHSIKIIEILSTFSSGECKRLKFLCQGDVIQILKQNTLLYTEMSWVLLE